MDRATSAPALGPSVQRFPTVPKDVLRSVRVCESSWATGNRSFHSCSGSTLPHSMYLGPLCRSLLPFGPWSPLICTLPFWICLLWTLKRMVQQTFLFVFRLFQSASCWQHSCLSFNPLYGWMMLLSRETPYFLFISL